MAPANDVAEIGTDVIVLLRFRKGLYYASKGPTSIAKYMRIVKKIDFLTQKKSGESIIKERSHNTHYEASLVLNAAELTSSTD